MALRVSPQAREALDDIWLYLARAREDLRPGLRSYPVGRYLIIYRVGGKDVLVLHVLHSSRDIAAIFGGP